MQAGCHPECMTEVYETWAAVARRLRSEVVWLGSDRPTTAWQGLENDLASRKFGDHVGDGLYVVVIHDKSARPI